MEVILLEKLRNLGVLGEKVKVKPGYARNYLIPQGKAVYANSVNIEKFEKRRAELEKREAEKHQLTVARKDAIAALGTVTLTAKSGDEGKLFGSIGTRDIALAIEAAGQPIEKREVILPEGAIRKTGEYVITIELESDIITTLKLNVIPEA
ncbi:MAG: 50S ribosomal protein L9 [Gammaproteobacteria bacterium]|nr:50S ribosomal protein L9 [Gammaproteobacteria bacterium]